MKKEKPDTEGLSLLEKAKMKKLAAKVKTFDPEEFEVAVLWIKGELTNGQINFAYNCKGAGAINRMAILLREMYRQGKIVIKENDPTNS